MSLLPYLCTISFTLNHSTVSAGLQFHQVDRVTHILKFLFIPTVCCVYGDARCIRTVFVSLVNILQLHFNRFAEYEKTRMHKLWDVCVREFGPIFRLDMSGQAPTVFISEPDDIEHVLKSTAKNQQRDLFSSLKYVRDTHEFFKKDKSGIMSE